MEIDMAMIEELEFAGRPYAVLLTKTDKLKPRQVEARIELFRTLLAQCRHLVDVVPTSAVSGTGRSQVIGMMKRIRTLTKESTS
jgi:GTP-binding protein EngB required for normal cell division